MKIKIKSKLAVMLCLIGITFVSLGSIAEKYWTVRMAGTMIAMVGLISLGLRIYERVKERRAERA